MSTHCLRVILCVVAAHLWGLWHWTTYRQEDLHLFICSPGLGAASYADFFLAGPAWVPSPEQYNRTRPHRAERFPPLHMMVTISNCFSSAGFGACSFFMWYFKISNYFSYFVHVYLFFIHVLCLKFCSSFPQVSFTSFHLYFSRCLLTDATLSEEQTC